MSDITELEQNLQDISDLNDQILDRLAGNDARVAELNAQIAALVAAANISAADKAALQAKIDAAVAKSQAIEDKQRASIPQVPPVGTPPLSSSFASRADFDAGVAAYQGPEAVTLDGTEVKAGTAPAIDFFTHSADGSISTSGPTD